MIVDSSALAEQVVADVIASAFDSAGQRCSALRILCLQEEIADRTLSMLKGAINELRVGNTDHLSVDIGPVISAEAKATIEEHIEAMRAKGRPVEQIALPADTARGTFVAPTIIELDSIADLTREVFGPVLHVIRYRRDGLDGLIDAINATGYGLTFGLHTRLDETIAHVTSRIKAGNLYINRNVIGAIVGVQPFGGRGLSGTGPKAGGPLYLNRLVQNAPIIDSVTAGPIDSALTDYIDWLEARGEPVLAEQAPAFGACSKLGQSIEMPGPVGERNLYTLHPRGCILLRAETEVGLLTQIAAVLANGCEGVIEAERIPPNLPPRVRARLSELMDKPLAGVLVEGGNADILSMVQAMADRPGAIVPVHVVPSAPEGCAQPFPLDWLLEEVSISINTTAAGGNASLMTLT